MINTLRLVTDKEKAEILNIFASVFTHSSSDSVRRSASEDQVHNHLRNLNIHKSMDHNEMHRRVLRELAGTVTNDI